MPKYSRIFTADSYAIKDLIKKKIDIKFSAHGAFLEKSSYFSITAIGGIQTSPTASNIWGLKGRKRAIHTTATASASRISSLVMTEKYPTFTDKYTIVTKGIAMHIALGIFLQKT